MKPFASLLQFQRHFSTDEKCRAYLEKQRWGDTPACVFCGSVNVTRLTKWKRFQCNEKECRKQFSVLVGTVAENTKIPLTKWFLAMYILSNHSKGISSLQLASWIGVTQRTAWFLNHRIREMLTDHDPELLAGIVEVDETVVGGSVSNMKISKRKKMGKFDNKTAVFGAVSRGGKVVTKILQQNIREHIVESVKNTVEEGTIMVTDENSAYKSLNQQYKHVHINHSKSEYVRGAAHTNTIEGFWSILKRQVVGIHHFISPKHLQRYCNEISFRYNNRELPQDERFLTALTNCEGRLTYKNLINKP